MSGSTRCYRSVLIVSLALLSGCIFTSEPAGQGQSIEDMGQGERDMASDQGLPGVDADMSVSDDMTPDMSDPCAMIRCGDTQVCVDGLCVGCGEDSDCGPGEVCSEESMCVPMTCSDDDECADSQLCLDGVCITPECTTHGDCVGANNRCASGLCVDLLTNKDHCGALDRACSSECAEGMCLCDDNNTEPLNGAVFDGSDSIVPWPHPQLIQYPSESLHTCADGSSNLAACNTLIPREDVALIAPHYLAVAVQEGGTAEAMDHLVFQGISPTHGKTGDEKTFPFESMRADSDRVIQAYRLVPRGPGEVIAFVLWGKDRNDYETQRLTAYRVQEVDGTLDVSQYNIKQGEPVSITGGNWVDFDVKYTDTPNGEMLALAVVRAKSVSSLNEGGELILGGFASQGSEGWSEIDPVTYDLEEVLQLSEGMGMEFITNDNILQLHLTMYSNKNFGEESPGSPDPGKVRAFVNHYIFSWLETESKFDSEPKDQQTLTFHDAGLLGLLLGDRSDLPSPFQLSLDDNNIVTAVGMARDTSGAFSDKTNLFHWKDSGESIRPSAMFEDKNLYDHTVVRDKDGKSRAFYVRDIGTNSSVYVSTLKSSGGYLSSDADSVKEVSLRKKYRRLGVVTGPHATGVLGATSNGLVDMYFVVNGQPVCKY